MCDFHTGQGRLPFYNSHIASGLIDYDPTGGYISAALVWTGLRESGLGSQYGPAVTRR